MSVKMMLALALTALFGGGAYAANDDFVRVEMKGTLHNDREGGRTTLDANGKIYDLDLGGSRSLSTFAERHDRSVVHVIGSLDNRDRKEVVVVDRIEAGSENVSYERSQDVRSERPVVRERTIIREKKDPFFKVGPLEIGN